MNTKLLSICTSFRRPHQLPDMLRSFVETRSEGTEMIVRLHDDDPRIEEYRNVVKIFSGISGMNFVVGPHICMQECLNHYTFLHPEIPYRQIITDDALYITPNWDTKLIDAFEKRSNGWGFICGDDRLNDNWFSWSHPSMEIWSYKMYKLIGYAYPRTVKHRGQDTYTKELCEALGFCPLVPEVIIRHLQGSMCENPDENLRWINSREAEQEALGGLQYWRENLKNESVRLIQEARAKGL